MLGNDIFVNEFILSEDYIPDNLVSRNKHINEMIKNINTGISYCDLKHVYINSKSGTGKTLVVNVVLNRLEKYIEDNKEKPDKTVINIVRIDCSKFRSEDTISEEIFRQLNGDLRELTKKCREICKTDYYMFENQDLYTYIKVKKLIARKVVEDAYYNSRDVKHITILFFDELDLIDYPEQLVSTFSQLIPYSYFDNELNLDTRNFRNFHSTLIGIIATSSKPNFLDSIGKIAYVEYSEILKHGFPNYKENELYDILKERCNAFKEDVISHDTLSYCAKIVEKKYHGNARIAISILHESGKIAVKDKYGKIDTDTIDKAEIKVLSDITLTKTLNFMQLHDRLLIYSVHIAREVLLKAGKWWHPNTIEVLRVYNKICEIIDIESHSKTHLSSRFTMLEHNKFLAAYIGKGNTRVMTLPEDVERIIDLFVPAEYLKKIIENYADLESTILANIK